MSAFDNLRSLLYSDQWLDEVKSTLHPGDPALSIPESERVLAVITEITWGADKGSEALAGFANGNARLLYSLGGGILGDLFQFSNIAASAKALVSIGQNAFASLPVEQDLPSLPPIDHVRVAVLTATERKAITVPGPEIIRPEHPLFRLFQSRNELWTQLFELQKSGNRQPNT